jgi:hypothetical protein
MSPKVSRCMRVVDVATLPVLPNPVFGASGKTIEGERRETGIGSSITSMIVSSMTGTPFLGAFLGAIFAAVFGAHAAPSSRSEGGPTS